MRRISFVRAFVILITGCIKDGSFVRGNLPGSQCPGAVNGYTYTAIFYGDSKMAVVPLSRLQPGSEWRFYLFPISKLGGVAAYSGTSVNIKGDPASPTSSWINTSTTYAAATSAGKKRYITQCVPQNATSQTDYKYLVEIPTIGLLDPRARIDP